MQKDKFMRWVKVTAIFREWVIKIRTPLLGMFMLIILAGCLSARAGSGDSTISLPTPTINPVFQGNQAVYPANPGSLSVTPGSDLFAPVGTEPTISFGNMEMDSTSLDPMTIVENTPTAPDSGNLTEDTQNAQETPTESDLLSQTPTPGDTATPVATPTPEDLPTVTIYDDNLNENWYIVNSTGVKYFLQSKNAVHDGTYGLALTPTKDYGNLAFTVKFGSSESFPRDQVLGVRFWLYSGDATVGTEDLAVSVVGSNDVAYWKWNDKSVTNTVDPVFPETRLYYLGFNNAIPPNTWVPVEVWLDDLKFEPEYKFVTGIYIKNGEDFRDTVYIDQVELIKKPGS